jgi:hypothetical protein
MATELSALLKLARYTRADWRSLWPPLNSHLVEQSTNLFHLSIYLRLRVSQFSQAFVE